MPLQALPNLLNGFSGCSSQMDCANKYINDSIQTQHEMNKSLHSGGGRSRRSIRSSRRGLRLSKYNKNKRGGDDAAPADPAAAAADPAAPVQDYYSCETPDPNVTTVVQFDSYGPDVSPLNSNNSSVDTNTTLINGQNNSLNDCYATGTCPETPCSASSAAESAAPAPSAPAQSGGKRKRTIKRKRNIKKKRKSTKRKSNKKKKITRRN